MWFSENISFRSSISCTSRACLAHGVDVAQHFVDGLRAHLHILRGFLANVFAQGYDIVVEC